jgi:hypothetical protein
LARTIVGTAVFIGVSLSIGRRLVFGLIRWANDNLVSEVPVITVILLLTRKLESIGLVGFDLTVISFDLEADTGV